MLTGIVGLLNGPALIVNAEHSKAVGLVGGGDKGAPYDNRKRSDWECDDDEEKPSPYD